MGVWLRCPALGDENEPTCDFSSVVTVNMSNVQRKAILLVVGWVGLLLSFAFRILTFDFWNGYVHLIIFGIGTIYWMVSLALEKPIKNFLVNIRKIKHSQNQENQNYVARSQ